MMEQISLMRQNVQELTQDAQDARAFIESMRSDVFEERVYVFTPKGMVIDLPVGATPVDFAYRIHTEVGHSCRGARVNGRWVPLDYQLKMGEQVDILTSKRPSPSWDWLNEELGFVKTNRARQKIKQWFRRQSREENVTRGRTVVDRELKRLGLSPELSVEDVAELFTKYYQREEDFYAAVGTGDVTGKRIANRLESYVRKRDAEEAQLPEPEDAPPPLPPSSAGKVNIRGTGGLLTNVARCCAPLPGEEIIGYVTRGRGVTIHRRDCANILSLQAENRERLIEVEWGTEEEQTFAVQIIISAYDRSGLLHDISGVLANEKVNMTSIKTSKRDQYNIVPIYITMEIPHLAKLNRVLGKIEQVPNVIDAHRIS